MSHQEQQQPMITDKKKQKEVQVITYGQNPISMKCPYCLEHIRSQIIAKPELVSIALGLSCFVLVPRFIMILLVVLLMQFTASRKHRCPLCQRQLGSDGKFLIYFTDEVYSLSFLSAGFIFTKKTIITVTLIGFIMTILSINTVRNRQQKWVSTTWSEYIQICIKGDLIQCYNRFSDKQFRNWQGHLVRLVDNRISNRKWYIHALSLYIKMTPSLSKDSKPDILITIDSDAVYYNSNVLSNLTHGDLIRFNCSLHEHQQISAKDVLHFHVEALQIIGHDSNYAMFTTEVEEEWIQVNVENAGSLQSEPDREIKNR